MELFILKSKLMEEKQKQKQNSEEENKNKKCNTISTNHH